MPWPLWVLLGWYALSIVLAVALARWFRWLRDGS
jgi:hypothetical protein